MPLIKHYFTPALLLLVLTCAQVSQSVPVMSKEPLTDSCVIHAQTLLKNVTHALTQITLFSAIDCPEQSVELNMKTNTPSVCAPKGSICSGITKSEFDQDSCLTNIAEDLHHYYTFLSAQPDPDGLLAPTVLSLRELMEKCFKWSLLTDLALAEAAADRLSTYDERLKLCKVLKGFQLRSITINRGIGYMKSGEDAN
ncbi:interleukin-12 subunit alpha-like [Sander lucioperca]|uniref:Interleukin-12 subunit alpha-like n=1 Tax=Sander lucioperca TaxID=283035 RepID=A0A8D0AKB3_SANLU|nr:interleukin-12 subunit alpha-like [Sander lucioperca]